MPSNLPEEAVWAAGLAARLRLVQVNSADAPPAQRREFLSEIVVDALADVPSGRREVFLAALSDRFPAWEKASAPPAAATTPPPPERPEQLLARVKAMLPNLPQETQIEFINGLVESGLVQLQTSEPAQNTSFGEQPQLLGELQQLLGVSAPVDVNRALRLLYLLTDMVKKLDQVACNALEKLPTRSEFNPVVPGNLPETVQKFLTKQDGLGEDEAAPALQKQLEKHLRWMGALMASHVGTKRVQSTVGREYAKWFLQNFRPDEIEDVVRAAGKGGVFFGSHCWTQYKQRFDAVETEDKIDKRVKDAVASITERIFRVNV